MTAEPVQGRFTRQRDITVTGLRIEVDKKLKPAWQSFRVRVAFDQTGGCATDAHCAKVSTPAANGFLSMARKLLLAGNTKVRTRSHHHE
jgi:hypothetical protein